MVVIINDKIYYNKKRQVKIEVPAICEYFKAHRINIYGVEIGTCPITELDCERPEAVNPDLCQIRLKELKKND